LAGDRKTRRLKLAVREGERSKREGSGKKPFYLTLNVEGIPYEPSRPAWIAEVNKLAAWLDPSCTHIRKQTYEDMCILKECLNDNFEYSGDLNVDFLRGLFSKAVTRKRTELIAYIKRGGKQPASFDAKIWKRLEKLATSQQREERMDHARYTNGCRRTLGRTGASSVHGVRQRLEALHGRSPDPDEVAKEMRHPKGYGKKDLEKRKILKNRNRELDEMNLEDHSLQIQSLENEVDRSSRDEDQIDRRQSNGPRHLR